MSSDDDMAIRVTNLSKRYEIYDKPRDRLLQMLARGRKQYFHEFRALHEVSFDVQRGETVGIIGRNGSGKSTLLQLLCGTLSPTSGSIVINGKVAALLELGAGFNPEFTGRENVVLSASLYGLTSDEIVERFDHIAEFADIGEFIDRPVKTYSSGMFVRLAFALQVHTDPEIFLIDEAMAVGDHRFVQKCYKKMEELKRDGTSLLLVSHDTTAIKMLCDRAMWIHDGKMLSIGPASEVVDAYRNWSDSIDKDVITSAAAGVDFETSHLRLGIGKLRLLNKANEECYSFVHGSTVKIEIPVKNRSIDRNTKIRVGFSIRNNRGIEITGSNTDIVTTDLHLPEEGQEAIFTVEFDLPLLAGGRYSLTVSLDSRNTAGEYSAEVLMPDCVFFDVDEKIKVYTLLGVEARFSSRLAPQPIHQQ